MLGATALLVLVTVAICSADAGVLEPDCTAEKAAKSAAAKATVGVGGRCDAREAAKDTASDAVDLDPDGRKDKVEDARDKVDDASDRVDDATHKAREFGAEAGNTRLLASAHAVFATSTRAVRPCKVAGTARCFRVWRPPPAIRQ